MNIISLIIIGLVSFLTGIALLNLKWGLCSFFALEILLPNSAQFAIGRFSIPVEFIMIILFFIIFLINGKYKNPLIKLPVKYKFYIILYITTSCIFSFFSNFSLFEQLKNVFRFAVQNVLSAYMLFSVIQNNKDIKLFLNIVFWATIVACIYGLFTYITKSNPYVESINSALGMDKGHGITFDFINEERGIINGRIMATMVHPLQWGQALTCIFSILIIFHELKIFVINKVFFTSGMLLIASNIFLSGSRAALVAFIIFLFFAFFYMPTKKKLKYVSYILLLAVFLIFIIPKRTTEAFINTTTASIIFWDNSYSDAIGIGGSSATMRLLQLYGTFEKVSKNPLFGLGKGYIIDEFKKDKGSGEMFGYESVFFYKVVEEGVLGLFFFLLAYYMIYAETIKKINQAKEILQYKSLIRGFYLSYLISILLTGIQGTFILFCLLATIITTFVLIHNTKTNNELINE